MVQSSSSHKLPLKHTEHRTQQPCERSESNMFKTEQNIEHVQNRTKDRTRSKSNTEQNTEHEQPFLNNRTMFRANPVASVCRHLLTGRQNQSPCRCDGRAHGHGHEFPEGFPSLPFARKSPLHGRPSFPKVLRGLSSSRVSHIIGQRLSASAPQLT